MTKAKFEAAKKLIDQNKYVEARKILKTIDHPTARAWETKLDAMDDFVVPDDIPKKKSHANTRIYDTLRGCMVRGCSVLVGAVVLILVVAALVSQPKSSVPNVASAPSQTSRPDIRPTFTDFVRPTSTESVRVTIIPTIQNRSGFVTTTPLANAALPTATITDTPLSTITSTPKPTITLVPNQPQTISAESEADVIRRFVRDYMRKELLSVEIADGRSSGGERVAILAYVSATTNPADLLSELGGILGVIGAAINDDLLDIDTITMVFGPTADSATGIISAQANDMVALINGDITPDEFDKRLTIEVLNGDTPAAPAPAVQVQSISPVSYYTTRNANVRSCARSDCDLLGTVNSGTTITVTGTTDGEEVVAGNVLWYQVNYGGQSAYIYSPSLTKNAPVRVVTAVPQQPSGQQPAAPVQGYPDNCTEAVAMGLTDVQAGQYSHLDRDDDGVACYGD